MQESRILPNTLCRVICIKPGFIGLTAPSFNYHIVFKKPGQQIKVRFEIIQDSVHADNGYILNNSLRVMDKEVRQELGLKDDVEYGLSLSQVTQIILRGTTSELEDLLTYGPEGYRTFAAQVAVENKIDSQSKLDLIYKFSGIDVKFQILHKIGDDDNEDIVKVDKNKARTYDTVGVSSGDKDEKETTDSVEEK